jgi:nucleoside-diphosphate-sugar epimerase
MAENNMGKVLVTGANGFIGRALCLFLKRKGYVVRAAVRGERIDIPGVDEYVQVGDISRSTDWQQALIGIDLVVHLAGCAHNLKKATAASFNTFRQVNVFATESLAKASAKAGIKRFIFVSSVKVNGEGAIRPYNEKDIPAPEDAYGMSKREAEEVLAGIGARTGLQTVILRLPLVYGPEAKANFKELIKAISSGVPLPLKGLKNRRSFLYIGNLTDAIAVCLVHPRAAAETFLLSDRQDVSTEELVKIISFAMNKRIVLFFFPANLLRVFSKIMGKERAVNKITGSLAVDSSKIGDLLGWKPPFTLEEGIRLTVKNYKS